MLLDVSFMTNPYWFNVPLCRMKEKHIWQTALLRIYLQDRFYTRFRINTAITLVNKSIMIRSSRLNQRLVLQSMYHHSSDHTAMPSDIEIIRILGLILRKDCPSGDLVICIPRIIRDSWIAVHVLSMEGCEMITPIKNHESIQAITNQQHFEATTREVSDMKDRH
jgi:hypothetical protein